MPESKGFLVVFAEPGSSIPDAEYQDWYDNEHIPLRVAVPVFHSWDRFICADGQKPTYLAYYDLESYESTLVAPYTTLAETRSEREKGILSKMEVLDRRTYEVYEGNLPKPSELYDPKKTAPYTLLVGVSLPSEAVEELDKWYEEEHIPMLAKVKGWVRTRRFVLKDSAKIGSQATAGEPPKFLAVHEWTTSPEEREATEEYKAASNTEWRAKLAKQMTAFEKRQFKSLRRFDRK